MANKSTAQECTNKRQALGQLRRKKWKEDIHFKTKAQETLYNTMGDHTITFCAGPAGTGKSFISLYYALKQLADKDSKVNGIILCRPLIPIDNESIGYLPGEIRDKVDPYMLAYWQNIEKIVGRQVMEVLINAEIIKVIPLAFFRGITLDNKVILYDEAQNSTPSAMKSFLTRLGEESQMVITGDVNQSDRKKLSGLEDALKRLIHLPEVGFSGFAKEDIVRHNLITKILENYENDREIHETLKEFFNGSLPDGVSFGGHSNEVIS